jgi:hypothetical protein
MPLLLGKGSRIMSGPKRISLEPRNGPTGLIIAVTFPMPFTGIMVTRDVAMTDESARRLIARVVELLAERGSKLLVP